VLCDVQADRIRGFAVDALYKFTFELTAPYKTADTRQFRFAVRYVRFLTISNRIAMNFKPNRPSNRLHS